MSNQSTNVAAVLTGPTAATTTTSSNTSNTSNHNQTTPSHNASNVSSTYTTSKLSGKAREAQEKLAQERKKATLILVHQFLHENGYLSSARELASNIGFNLSGVTCADNVDLETIVIEYEEYYGIKFGKRPKLFRKIDSSSSSSLLPSIGSRGGGEMERESKQCAKVPYASSNPLLNKMRQRSAQMAQAQLSNASNPNYATATAATTTANSASNGSSATNMNGSNGNGTTTSNNPVPSGAKSTPSSRSGSALPKSNSITVIDRRKTATAVKPGSASNKASSSTQQQQQQQQCDMDILVRKIPREEQALHANNDSAALQQLQDESPYGCDGGDFYENRILRPLPEEFYFGEMRELAEMIRRDILVSNPEVRWDDIAGLADAKQLLKEAVVIPLKYPELFQTIPVLTPWNGVLLFGPPGTGKTMLAKAVATECRTTFFNISASSIVSKWRGDSEKLVRILFELAEHYAPSTIFLDELDSIMSQRQSGASGGEHEGSRRMKTELLIQMDGLSKRKGQVFVLAASNLPWDLDQAMLRRLEKRILVGLPDTESRKYIMRKLLSHDEYSSLTDTDFECLAQATENYSGADLSLVCKESAMKKLRQVMTQIAIMERDSDVDINPSQLLQQNKITLHDVQNALSSTRPSGGMYRVRYEEWQTKYGSDGAQ